ncbi:MAG: beta-lactamase family protein [Planctomycetes bacterium]|nr:beta-lactamase family protein [Planctomycetota bacterium]
MEAKKPVQPDSLFRLASISKSITGIVVMRAVEKGRLSLDDQIVPLLSEMMPAEILDTRWRGIGGDRQRDSSGHRRGKRVAEFIARSLCDRKADRSIRPLLIQRR